MKFSEKKNKAPTCFVIIYMVLFAAGIVSVRLNNMAGVVLANYLVIILPIAAFIAPCLSDFTSLAV